MESQPIPLLPEPRGLDEAERSELVEYYEHARAMGNEWLYRKIVDENRIDILAVAVLGYEVKPFHLALIKWQLNHPDSLQLVFRGAGKTTTCTVTKAIHLLCKDRNLRILLASKTVSNAESFLAQIKAHLENNELLISIFGAFYDPQKVAKWDSKAIQVVGRTVQHKESSIEVTGVSAALASRHYDVIIADDLVDEDSCRTAHMRGITKTWYYQTLDPCLEPPDPNVPHRGEFHRLGTRYHFDDIYGHLEANELKDHTQVIPALNDNDQSPWPEKYPPRWFKAKRRKAGLIIFSAQYLCNTEAMRGEIFQYDDCQQVNDDEIPEGLRKFMGVDLAIGEKEQNDLFAIVVIGVDKVKNIYVLDYFAGHLRFGAQTKAIKRLYRQHDPIRAAIETNAYQKAQYQHLKDGDVELRLKPVQTDKDKISRAWKLSAIFEDSRMFFRKNLGPLIDQLVLFPNHRFKDGFDALDLAVKASKMRDRKKKRRQEPGLI